MLVAAAFLLAQTAPACTAMDTALPAPLAGWTNAAPRPGLMLGQASMLDISGYAATSFAEFTIEEPGIYGIALDQAGWIDVAPKNGASLASVEHGHGPECSTIRKIVRFDLKPGVYRLTLSKLTGPPRVMLIKD